MAILPMCLIIFDWHEQNKELTLLANRDEFFDRPAHPIDYWSSHPSIFGGRDLSAGGTWLSVTKTGRLAAVTNYREMPSTTGDVSRGEIPVSFLNSVASSRDFAHQLAQKHSAYSGFNALFFDGDTLTYHGNKSDQTPRILNSGVYGLSNHLLDTPWPKLVKAKQGYIEIRESETLSAQARDLAWLALMRDLEQAKDEDLPETGIGAQWEKFLSSIFIRSQAYGTRATSLVSITRERITFTEQSFAAPNDAEPNSGEATRSIRSETIIRDIG
jgi:uncharacterized protein with NRDE domain